MTERLRLMAVHAHPDDESSKGAATMARYVDEGVDVLVVTCTGGERGSILNPRLAHDPARARQHRRGPPRARWTPRARSSVSRQAWLGFVDSGLPEGDPLPPLPDGLLRARRRSRWPPSRWCALVREFRPHVVTTYDENGGYPHPDHVMCHRVTVEAFDAAGDPGAIPAPGRRGHPLKLYYMQTMSLDAHGGPARDHARRRARLALRRVDRAVPGDPPRTITTRVPCADWFPVRDRALLAHATQVDPDGAWFACPMPLQQTVWPTEDYELVHSRVADRPARGRPVRRHP